MFEIQKHQSKMYEKDRSSPSKKLPTLHYQQKYFFRFVSDLIWFIFWIWWLLSKHISISYNDSFYFVSLPPHS